MYGAVVGAGVLVDWDVIFTKLLSAHFRASGIGGKPDNPVGYFTLEDDW